MNLKKEFYLLLLFSILGFLLFATSFNDKEVQSYSREDILGEWHGDVDELGGVEVILFKANCTSWFTYVPEGNTDGEWLTKNDSWELDGKVVVEDERGLVISYEIQVNGNEINLICPEDSTIYTRVNNGIGNKGVEIITMEEIPVAFDYFTDGLLEEY